MFIRSKCQNIVEHYLHIKLSVQNMTKFTNLFDEPIIVCFDEYVCLNFQQFCGEMSYPQRFEMNRYESVPGSRSNDAASMQNSSHQGQFSSIQAQSHGRESAPVTHPNASVQPPNMFFPPMDFSIPPPNFNTQVNVCSIHFSTSIHD